MANTHSTPTSEIQQLTEEEYDQINFAPDNIVQLVKNNPPLAIRLVATTHAEFKD